MHGHAWAIMGTHGHSPSQSAYERMENMERLIKKNILPIHPYSNPIPPYSSLIIPHRPLSSLIIPYPSLSSHILPNHLISSHILIYPHPSSSFHILQYPPYPHILPRPVYLCIFRFKIADDRSDFQSLPWVAQRPLHGGRRRRRRRNRRLRSIST